MGNPVKVLFAINRLNVGGAESMVLEQIAALDRGKFDPYLLQLYRSNPTNCDAKVTLPPERRILLGGTGPWSLRLFAELARCLRREKFDAVITNLFDANLLVRAAAILSRVPVILSYEHNVYANKRRWQIIVDRILARWTYRVLVGSRQVLDFTSKQERLPESKFKVVYNSAKLAFGQVRRRRDETLAKLGLDPTATYVATAGRLIEQKGHVYLIDALAMLPPESNVEVAIFGQGVLQQQLLEHAAERGVAKRVHLLGVAPMADVLAISDIFAFPSLWEGLSIALINAMDAGCPIVATRVSGTEEAVVDGESGLLVPPGDATALRDALALVLHDPQLAARLGSAAHGRASLFSIENNVKTIEQTILDGLSRRP